MSSPAPVKALAGLRYNARAGRYVLPSGRFVTREAVLKTLEDQITATKASMRALAGQLQSGAIDLPTWQISTERAVKSLHVLSTALEHGGFAQLAPADLGWIGARVREQYKFLANFAREIETGRQRLDGRFAARVDLYAEAGRSTAREAVSRRAVQSGATHRKRVLGVADHCHRSGSTPGCVDQAALGFLPIGDKRHVPIGSCLCRSRCHCSWTFETRGAA